MARSKGNIALIVVMVIFICLSIFILLPLTVYFWKAWEHEVEQRQTAENARNNATIRADVYKNAYNLIKFPLGRGDEGITETQKDEMRTNVAANDAKADDQVNIIDEVTAIEEEFQTQKLLLDPSDPTDDAEKNYPMIARSLLTTIEDLKKQVAQGKTDYAQIVKEKQEIQAQSDAVVKVKEDARLAAVAARNSLDSEYVVYRQDLKTQNGALAGQLAAKAADNKAVLDKAALEKKQLESQLASTSSNNTALKERISNLTTTKVDSADGRITRVNQAANIVWINLGKADGLNRQQTFSVYDQNTNDFSEAKVKGNIEVTRVIDDHLAEARITHDELTEPLLPNDIVFSPTWQPGRKTHFALVGLLDYNDDARSDASLIRSLILSNGGEIDAIVDENGKRTGGALTVDTRYLVQGERPTSTSDTETLKAYTAIITEADRYGVERISVAKLLEMMGYQLTVSGSDGGTRPSSRFRERRPGDAYK